MFQPRALEILQQAKQILDIVEAGLQMVLSPNPSLRLVGFCNVVVFGRSVTMTLEHLRSVVKDFDAWYKPRTKAMSEDPKLKYLYNLRSDILHEGRMQTYLLKTRRNLWPVFQNHLEPSHFSSVII